jgi:hypothetical protein
MPGARETDPGAQPDLSADGNPFLGGDAMVRSLNRARVTALPAEASAADRELVGLTGYRLLGAAPFRDMVVRDAGAHREDPGGQDPLTALDEWFGDERSRPRAVKLAEEYGRRLGTLLWSLHRGDPADRAARTEWSDRHWDFWQALPAVLIGGGLVAGRAGPVIVAAARGVLERAGADGLHVALADHPAHLPLVGLARALPADARTGAVLDFGHTSVKRGIVRLVDGQVVSLEVLEPAPTPCDVLIDRDPQPAMILRRWDAMASAMERTWRALVPADRDGGTQVVLGVSLGTYLDNGQPPADDPGCYGSLRLLSPNLAEFARADLARRLRRPVHMVMLGDGDAAAASQAGAGRMAVLTLGTAIGLGFAPPAAGMRPLAAGLTVRLLDASAPSI